MVNWFLMEMQGKFNGQRILVLTNSDGTNGYSYAEKWTLIYTSHHIEHLTQNSS